MSLESPAPGEIPPRPGAPAELASAHLHGVPATGAAPARRAGAWGLFGNLLLDLLAPLLVILALVVAWVFGRWAGGVRSTREAMRTSPVDRIAIMGIFTAGTAIGAMIRRWTRGARPLPPLFEGGWGRAVRAGVVAGMLLLAFSAVYALVARALFGPRIFDTSLEQDFRLILEHGAWTRLAGGVEVAGLAPLCEEILFRGLLFGAFWAVGRPRLGAVVSAALFAAMHGSAWFFLHKFVFALVMTALYVRYRTLWAPITAHAVNNFVPLLAMLLHVAPAAKP